MEIGVAQLATVLTVAGLAVYVLGLIGLALSINLFFTEKWATAWYAVSLMPRTIVAGQGMRIWRLGWIRIVAVVIVYAAVFNMVRRILVCCPSKPEMQFSDFLTYFVVSLVLLVIAIITAIIILTILVPRFMSPTVASNEPPPRPVGTAATVWLWIIGSALSIFGGFVLILGLGLWPDSGHSRSNLNWDTITVGFLIILVALFFVAIPASGRIRNPLPLVRLIGAPEASEKGAATPVTSGWLVAHSGGYWHLFDAKNVLLSIPDERVTEARVHPGG